MVAVAVGQVTIMRSIGSPKADIGLRIARQYCPLARRELPGFEDFESKNSSKSVSTRPLERRCSVSSCFEIHTRRCSVSSCFEIHTHRMLVFRTRPGTKGPTCGVLRRGATRSIDGGRPFARVGASGRGPRRPCRTVRALCAGGAAVGSSAGRCRSKLSRVLVVYGLRVDTRCLSK